MYHPYQFAYSKIKQEVSQDGRYSSSTSQLLPLHHPERLAGCPSAAALAVVNRRSKDMSLTKVNLVTDNSSIPTIRELNGTVYFPKRGKPCTAEI